MYVHKNKKKPRTLFSPLSFILFSLIIITISLPPLRYRNQPLLDVLGHLLGALLALLLLDLPLVLALGVLVLEALAARLLLGEGVLILVLVFVFAFGFKIGRAHV